MRCSTFKYLRSLGRGVLWAFGVMIAAVLINLLATRLLDGVQAWIGWLRDHSLGLLIWRLCLYVALIYGWLWMRARLLQREPEAAQRLRRAEGAGVAALMLLEMVNAISRQETL